MIKPVKPVKATFQRKDAWDVRWSDDDENAFAAMEKTKMVVYRGAEPEEEIEDVGPSPRRRRSTRPAGGLSCSICMEEDGHF